MKKPVLVELHSFPGYQEDLVTPLPVGLTASFIFKVVTDAQEDLEFRVGYFVERKFYLE